MGAGKEVFDAAMVAGVDRNGLAAAAALSTVLGGVFLALGRRRKPLDTDFQPRAEAPRVARKRTLFRRGR